MSKVNVVKELSLALDGGSIERTGFEILEAKHSLDVWEVTVEAYKKEGELISHEDEASLATLVARLTESYVSEVKWDIISVTKVMKKDAFKLELTLKGEENETEDGSRVKEQVEA